MSFVLRLVPDVPPAVSADGIVGEVEAVATGERFVVHDGGDLIAVLQRALTTTSGAAEVSEP
jgi:hypothetical protein